MYVDVDVDVNARGNDDGTYDIDNFERMGIIMRIVMSMRMDMESLYGQCGIEGAIGCFPRSSLP